MSKIHGFVFAWMFVLTAVGSAHAADPAVACESGKLKVAGKYASCLLSADSKALKTNTSPVYTTCASKFSEKWQSSESKGEGMCPGGTGDETGIQTFLDACTQSVADALAGGTLPDCPTDLATCNADLSTCDGSLTTCNGNYSTCSANLTTCSGDLSTAQNDLTTCSGNLGTCNGSLSTCSGSLTTCNGNYSTCSANLTTCSSDLGTCNGSLTTCSGSLATCSTDVATCNAGTAAAGEVLSGETFSSNAGLGVVGTMTNVGQQNVTPGTAAVTITQGYHDGTGSVTGDADLVAGNIASGVNLFGVTGSLTAGSAASPLKTGQTICYNASGTVIACAGTGHDGELQKGVARSFTDNGDGTVTDNATGLMWEKLSDDGSIHDADNAYTWTNAFATKVATLNSGSFAGYTDWRVPNEFELYSLVNLGAFSPATYSAFDTGCVAACTVLTCSCTRSLSHWSSSTWQGNPPNAWYVHFTGGTALDTGKTNTHRVRAVRAGS